VSRIDLTTFGLTDRERSLFDSLAEDGFVLGRVSRVDRGLPLVLTAEGHVRAEPAMHLMRMRGDGESRAVVGDWVALSQPEGHDVSIIEAILPRSSAFIRKDPGISTAEQVVAANVNTVFVMQSLSGRGVNLRRLERELVLAWESGARPLVVLTKADLAEDWEQQRAEAASVSAGVDVVATSAFTGEGLDELSGYLGTGSTVALLGASGVGKSTLINRLVGELALECRFADCRHETEPGCAVLEAVEAGELAQRRLDSYHDLRRELDALAAKTEERTRRERERQKRIISKASKSFFKQSEKGRGRG
jgi:ribosome biogenesis GTPase